MHAQLILLLDWEGAIFSKYLQKNPHLCWNINETFIHFGKNEMYQNASFQFENSDFETNYLNVFVWSWP